MTKIPEPVLAAWADRQGPAIFTTVDALKALSELLHTRLAH